MVAARRALAIAAIGLGVVGAGPARADSPHLDEARRAVEAVQYDRAQALLVEALQDGGNGPAAMIEIYRLSATTAIVLDQGTAAEQYYRRMLALAPDATLPDDVSPKLREPFVAAQAYMAVHGRLAARVTRQSDVELAVVIDTDPLAMAAGAATVTGGAVAAAIPLVEGRAVLRVAGPVDEVAIVDEHGNQMVLVPAAEIAVATPSPAPRVRPGRSGVPVYRRWWVYAIPAVVAAGVGVGFGLDARSTDSDLQQLILENPRYTDYQAALDRRDRDALVTNIAFGTAGALAIVAAIMLATRPDGGDQLRVVPTASPGGAGVMLIGNWP